MANFGFKKVNLGIILLDIIVVTMIGLVRTAYILDAFSVSIIPIVSSSIILIFAKDYHPFAEKRNLFWTIFLSGLFIIMLSAEEVLKMFLSMDGEIFNMIFILLYPLTLLISLLIDIDYALCMSTKYETVTDDHTKVKHFKLMGIYDSVWLIIPLMYVFAIAYFPGALDSDFDIDWIGGGTPVWSDWHTVGFAFFVRICTIVIHKPFMVTLIQTLMYILTINYAVKILYKHFPGNRRIGYIYVIMFIIFSSYCCMHVADMVKDNCSTPMMLAFAVSMLDYVLSIEHEKKQYINIICFGFLAAIFRHSMIVAVVIPLVCIGISELRNRDVVKETARRLCMRLVAIVFLIIALYLILTEVFAFGILKAERNPAYVKYSIPMNLVGSMAYRSSVTGLNIDDDIVEKMEKIIPLEKWREYYSPFDSDPLCREWYEIGENVCKLNDPEIARDILKVDWYYFTHYPKECLLSYFDVTSPVWEIAKSPVLAMYSPAPVEDFAEVHHLRKGSMYVFCESMKNFLASFAIGRAIVYRGGIYIYMLVVISVILVRKKRIRVWFAMLPIVIYALLLMLSIPQPTSRYTMCFSTFAVLFGILAFLLPAKYISPEQSVDVN